MAIDWEEDNIMQNNEVEIDQPVKLLSAELVAREIIKMKIREQIAEIHSLIQLAKKNGEVSVNFNENIAESTKIILEKAGYEVDEFCGGAEISWKYQYDLLSDDEDTVMQLAQEAGVQIITLDEYRNCVKE